jgi:hypothetical protein
VVRDILLVPSDVVFSVPEVVASPSTSKIVDVSSTPFGPTSALDVDVRFNSAVLQVTTVQKTSVTGPLNLTWNVPSPGQLKVILFGTATVSGSGPIVRITFSVIGATGSSTPLNIEKARVSDSVKQTDDGGVSLCPPSCSDGESCTADACFWGQCVHDPLPDTVVCRAAAGVCDVAETCDGSGSCPPNALAPAGTVCRPSNGDCDATETCTGLAATCPPDAAVTAPPGGSPALGVGKQTATASIAWSLVPQATFHDVVRGSLAVLGQTAGNFASATETCLADNLHATSVDDATPSPPDAGYWYLVRPANCLGPGTYDTGSGSQVGSRDSEIQASGHACP